MEKEIVPYKKDTYLRDFKFINFALKLYFDQTITGLENIPDGPALFLVNHLKFADSPLVAAAYTNHTGRPLRFLAQDGYFNGDGIRTKSGKRIFKKPIKKLVENTHMIPVDRSGTIEGLKQITRDLNAVFERDESAAVHPEATRADNGMVNKFYPAMTRIAVDAGVPIIGVGINYYETASLHPLGVDVTFNTSHPQEEYAHGWFRTLPMGQRVKVLTSLVEKEVALSAHLELSGEYMQDIRDRREAEIRALEQPTITEIEQ